MPAFFTYGKLMNSSDYIRSTRVNALLTALEQQDTPCLAVDLDVIRKKFDELHREFTGAAIYYAVKANPANEVLTLLHELGSRFDIASIYELNKVMALGVPADHISFGNTIKKQAHVSEFYRRGVRLFASDSENDIRMLAEAAPGAKVYIRLLTEHSKSADWPLSRKFGCSPDMALELLQLAAKLGLVPYGISFHVGSQQRDISTWKAALDTVKMIYEASRNCGISLQMINMGGGFPGSYLQATNSLAEYADMIRQYLFDTFAGQLPELILEPGRSLVADAGLLATEVVLVARKGMHSPRWVYVDIGKFGGLIETMDEAIKYPVTVSASLNNNNAAGNSLAEDTLEAVILAGPTCDSMDILYEHFQYEMPLSLAAGDRLLFASTGAYTTSYSSVEFNGFPPLRAIYLDSSKL